MKAEVVEMREIIETEVEMKLEGVLKKKEEQSPRRNSNWL